jgi:DNA helicase-2/ATP-dependent DNA helicase PcrA
MGFEGDDVRVTTLHSLALRALRVAQIISDRPTVLQKWENKNIFDLEFSVLAGLSKSRAAAVREAWEAYWQTGDAASLDVAEIDPPISEGEREQFLGFHRSRRNLYECVLPGELVQLCVEKMDANLLVPSEVLKIEFLIVDEFQDLNPMDLRFVHGLADAGVKTFICGDDDQSLYSFRHASPEGIQDFPSRRGAAGDHTLRHCFRSTPAVLNSARTLIEANAAEGRVPKDLVSMYERSDPALDGVMEGWGFDNADDEAEAVAHSCSMLIERGMEPGEIMILLASKPQLADDIESALERHGVDFHSCRSSSLTEQEIGRAASAIFLLVENSENLVALRTLLGLQRGIGARKCIDVASTVISNNLGYREIFSTEKADELLGGVTGAAVKNVAEILTEIQEWNPDDLLDDRRRRLSDIAAQISGEDSTVLESQLESFPDGMQLSEAANLLVAESDRDRRAVLRAYAKRTGDETVFEEELEGAVTVLTMHGAKGLGAKAVFIPGLEQSVLPGDRRAAKAGQTQEAARMLYVSMTRAKYACFVSFSRYRPRGGNFDSRRASDFASQLGIKFFDGGEGLSEAEAEEIVVGAAAQSS